MTNQFPDPWTAKTTGGQLLLGVLALLLTFKWLSEESVSYAGTTRQWGGSAVVLGGLLALTATYLDHPDHGRSFGLETRLLWLGLELKIGSYPDLP